VKTYVEFRSSAFPSYAEEEEQIAAGRFGKRLAEFMTAGLERLGVECEEPVAEDWGWLVPLRGDVFKCWIGCGNYYQFPDGFLCFIKTATPSASKFFKQADTLQRIGKLQQAINTLLAQNPEVRDIKWWSEDDVDHPRLWRR
jgi:hypothetical protein